VRVVLDTNVFVSGVFFAGMPGRILDAWGEDRVSLVISPPILDEYYRVGARLSEQHPGVDLNPVLALLAVEAEIVDAPALATGVCADPDDDKFLACALAADVRVVVSGDRHLLDVSPWESVEVLTPRQFVARYLKANS